MNDPLLIEKHLADGLTDEESAQLEAAMGGDAVVARRLVAAARLDQRLATRLGPGRSEPAILARLNRTRVASNLITRWRRPLAMAAALVLTLGLAAAVGGWIRSMGGARFASMVVDPPRATRPFVPAPVPVVSDRGSDPPRVEPETPAMASLRQFLSLYYLTDLKLETGRPLEEALERLLLRARELNHLKNPVIERLSVELEAAEPGDGRPDTVVALPLKNISLMDGLNWVAAVHRSEVFLKEPGVITFRPWEPDESDTLLTEVVRVRLDLLTRPVATDGQSPAAADAGLSEAGGDPFVEITKDPTVLRLTPIELLQSWGIAFGGQASATYDEATAALTICHTGAALRTVKELVALDSKSQEAMVLIGSKVLESTNARFMKDELLTEEQFQHWLREMNQTKGVNLLMAPGITMRSGQSGIVESIRETEDDWQGLRLPVMPIFEGQVVKAVGAVELRLPVIRKAGELLVPQDMPAGELVTTASDFELTVPPGHTAVFSVNDSPDGPHFVVALTVIPVEPSGQRVDATVEAPATEGSVEDGDDAR